MKHTIKEEKIIESQLNSGFKNSEELRESIMKIMYDSPKKNHSQHNILKASWLDTILGPMVSISDEESLYLLEFVERKNLENEIEKLKLKTKSTIISGRSKPIDDIEKELEKYFKGELKVFKTKIHLFGTEFQKLAWRALMDIPYGETRSYAEQAKIIGSSSAFRAVANANGMNQIAIVIPCHRVINSDGKLGGYAGGIKQKLWLINHEKSIKNLDF